MKQRGFTIIELVVVLVVLAIVGIVFWHQKNHIQSVSRDDHRRGAINAMYYNLEDVFYAKNHYYPRTIGPDNLTAMDKGLFKDPGSVALGKAGSDYHYDPTGCTGDQCEGYTLRAAMENESDFIKTSRHGQD